MTLLLGGRSVKADASVGWLVDYAGPMNDALKTVWAIATLGDHDVSRRIVDEAALKGVPAGADGLPPADDAAAEAARHAIVENIQSSCGTTLAEAITTQAKHSAGFMGSKACRKGTIGAAFTKTMAV